MKHLKPRFLLAAACLLLAAWPVVRGADARTNVILIMGDDISWDDFGCYGNAAARRFPGTIIPTRPYDVAVNSPFTTVRNMTGSFKADADLGFANLGLTTAYQDVDIDFRVEGDFTSANLSRFAAHVFSKTFTQEAILTSPDAGARFNWVLGAFYYHNKGAFDPLNVEARGNVVLSRFGLQRTKAYAA